MATVHSSRGRRPRARKKAQGPIKPAQIPTPAKPPVSISKLITELIQAISQIECARRSLSEQEIGAAEQVVLDQARKALWRVHDALIELPGADDDDDEEDES